MSVEKIKNVPDEWMTLLNQMPDLKEYFMEEAEDEFFDGVPEDFFTYCYDEFFDNSYKNYEPFFTCFERGKEVFDNFYEAYGNWDIDEDDEEWAKIRQEHQKAKSELKSDETKLKEIAKRYIEGINYILSFEDEEEGYDFEEMDVKILTKKEFDEEYDTDEIRDDFDELKEEITDIVEDDVFPDFEENFLRTLSLDALPDRTCNNELLEMYILWPISKIDDVENPFRPYFELWIYDIDCYVTDDEILIVF